MLTPPSLTLPHLHPQLVSRRLLPQPLPPRAQPAGVAAAVRRPQAVTGLGQLRRHVGHLTVQSGRRRHAVVELLGSDVHLGETGGNGVSGEAEEWETMAKRTARGLLRAIIAHNSGF